MRSTARSTPGIRSTVHPSAYAARMSSTARRWRCTPSTTSTVNGLTGGSASFTRSCSVVSGSTPRRSDSYSTSIARLRALERAATASAADPAQVPAVAGVDLHLLAGAHEERHLDLGAGLERGRFRATGGPVTLD